MVTQKRQYVKLVESVLGHALPPSAIVHHVDHNRENNRNDNLVVIQNQAEHFGLHRRLRILRAGGNPWTQRICCTCKTIKDIDEFGSNRSRRDGISIFCLICATKKSSVIYNRKCGRPDDWQETPQERVERNRRMANRLWQKKKAG